MKTRTRKVDENGGFYEELSDEQSSASLSLNSRGQLQWDLKVYKDDPAEWAKTAKEFLKEIVETMKEAERLGLIQSPR